MNTNVLESTVSQVAKRADEIEQGREVPADLLDQLGAAGCLRMVAPARHGGRELPMPEVLRVLEEVARADGSTAWVLGQIALSQLIIGCAPPETVDAIYASGPDLLAAGAVAPKGRAAATGSGWRITGQWPFVTGCGRAEWFYLNCVLVADRAVQVDAQGVPLTRIVLVPASDVEIIDTWRVLGLRGTGSHHVGVAGAACALSHGLSLREGEPATERAVAAIAQSSLIIAAVAAGIAAGALEDVTELAAAGKRRALGPGRIAQSAVFQDRLGEAHITLRAARALLYSEAEAAAGREGSTLIERTRLRAAAAQVTTLACRVVDDAHLLAGGTAVYETSPMQRRLRDVHTATQHFVAGRDSYGALGALLVGESGAAGLF